MKRLPMYKIKYTFKNGNEAEFFIDNLNEKNPIHRVVWKRNLNKKNLSAIFEEYLNNCVPVVYQQIANYTGKSIIWADKSMVIPPKIFNPQSSVQ